MHDRINHGMKQSAVIFPCISDNVSSTVKSVIYFVQQVARYDLWFPCSVHLDARPNQPRHETKCGDFGTYFLRQRIINRQERYSFRATSCTLRERDSILSRASWYTTKSITAWNKVRWFLRVFFQTTHYQPSRALFISNVACNLLHDRTTQGTLFNPFPAFPISCNKLHATMHDRITHGMLFNPFGYLRFRVTGWCDEVN